MPTPPDKPTPEEEERLAHFGAQIRQREAITDKMSRIKHKIGIYSGKGGVGKTTIAVNLAALMARDGAGVGLFDADIDCPNITHVIHVSEHPDASEASGDEEGTLFPPSAFGVKVMSMAFFHQDEEEATIWRGPMIHNALTQLLRISDWGELECLVVDLPPGTADAPLTIMQTLALDGFIVVTTPQELAKLDAVRSINMIRRMNLNVLGIVENFSGPVFGTGAGDELARETGLPFLGRFEMREDYRDAGEPAVLTSEAVADEYASVLERLRRRLDSLPPSTS